jgi:hypothetical protein
MIYVPKNDVYWRPAKAGHATAAALMSPLYFLRHLRSNRR